MPNKRNKKGECVYCGKMKSITKDHIPPKCLFSKPRPNNLISVPSCESCRIKYTKDDEYFKNMLALRIDAFDHPEAKKIIPSVIRSYEKKHKIGFRKSLFDNLREVELRTKSGLIVGKTGAYNVDFDRLNVVVIRIIKGLFYKEKGQRLPNTHYVLVYSDTAVNLSPESKIKTTIINPLLNKEPTVFGDEIFTYRFSFLQDDPLSSIWLLVFFKSIYFVGFTVPYPH
ncbi:MAG: hypothetical protein H8D45_02905 [Bacteroidetes bacterium]|nr:hypothetical protein [Bacteroidota bacterium]